MLIIRIRPTAVGAAYHRGVTRRAVTYASYLKVTELLALQVERSGGPDGPEHDELLFIVIHQVYELWFKQLRHELRAVQAHARGGRHRHGAPPAQPGPEDPQDAGRPGRRPRDDDPAPVPLVPRPPRFGVRVPVGWLPPGRGDARAGATPRRSGPSRPGRRRAPRSRPPRPGRRSGILPGLPRPAWSRHCPPSRPSPTSGSRRSSSPSTAATRRRPRRGATRRPRRGRPGVALPARQDGRADHRDEARDRRLERRRVPARHALPPASRTSGRSAPACDGRPTPNRNPRDVATFPAARGRLRGDRTCPRGPPQRPRPVIPRNRWCP